MTDVAQLTRVGDGEFCASCFGALLDAGGREAAQPEAPPARGAVAKPSGTPKAGTAATRQATCLVCDRDLSAAPAVVFLGGEICGPCSAEMAAELEAGTPSPSSQPHTQPSLPSRQDAGEELRARDARERSNSTEGATDAAGAGAATAELFTPGVGTVRCAGCERPMPGPGSYRVLRGKPYCSACLPFFASLASDRSSSIPASSSPIARPGQCDCCRRALDDASQQRDGFALCSACLSSDADLALSVARARHRRALGRLRSKLEGAE